MDHSESLKKVGNRCSICGKTFSGFGNNSQPLDRGPCCDECNYDIVLSLRMFLLGSTKYALLVSPKGTIRYVRPSKDAFSVEELQGHVGGYFEYIPPRENPQFHFIVNEEGLLKRLDYNALAFEIFGLRVVGNLLVCPRGLVE